METYLKNFNTKLDTFSHKFDKWLSNVAEVIL